MNQGRMDDNENEHPVILVAKILKSLVLIVLGCAVLVALSAFLYRLWQSATGLGLPLFLVAEATTVVAAYYFGMLPEVDRLRRKQ